MTFTIITHVPHIRSGNLYFAYAPYVNEMNIWLKFVDRVIIVAPIEKGEISPVHSHYQHERIDFIEVPSFSLVTAANIATSVIKVPLVSVRIFNAMRQSDHIHLRCPGNMGLLGAVVQILFPSKKKTAKYAGNWDPAAVQPWSYRFQRFLIGNSFLTRNMTVLVYGKWDKMSNNLKAFFTATYSESEIKPLKSINDIGNRINFIFAGMLTEGKNPLYAVKIIGALKNKGLDAHLSVYGDGQELGPMADYIKRHQLELQVTLYGNISRENLKEAYQNNHFVILPSKSEGWPKVLAEGMFWGCIPLSTSVSCVPYMLDYGNRGLLLSLELDNDTASIITLIESESTFVTLRESCAEWSRQFTMEFFEAEIKKILQL